jgi:hypothetical protein
VIAAELVLNGALHEPATDADRRLGVVNYHSSLLLLTGSPLTMFWYALVATAVALLWPLEKPTVAFEPSRRLVAYSGPSTSDTRPTGRRGSFAVQVDGCRPSGYLAARAALADLRSSGR